MSHASQRRPGRRSVLAGAVALLGAAALLAATPALPAAAAAGGRGKPPHVSAPTGTGSARQVITVHAQGTYATVTAWQLSPVGWRQVFATSAARIGAHGLTDGATRKQGTLTTPTGVYTITQGFGNGPAPQGTRMPYHRVTPDDWWVEDPQSPYYNSMRTSGQGGFPLTEAGDRGSEHLVDYPVQYDNALVIDFNMHPAVPGRGAGIFLHDLSTSAGPTAGCVAVPADMMSRFLRWLDPAAHPVIEIG
ncbi:L,D-transpeptidase family protein [Streptacidiphilus anmyonensis]|uniref:L,D-transpeptidase family protein n=1 Tax=Streptacidiphilus anmyonensis TaxID=405782 RepID=UPI0005AB6B98|nr:L,D-transpeptidase family protein [Streptacidiphilus anmyonensis]